MTQERTLDGIKITRIGRGHYNAQSEHNPRVSYSVDIMANDILGSCECIDFQARRLQLYKQVKAPFDHFRCKHLRAVRNHVLNQLLLYYSHQDPVSGERQ